MALLSSGYSCFVHLGVLSVQAVLHALLIAVSAVSVVFGEQEPQYKVSDACGRKCDEQKNAEYDAHSARA